MRCEAMQSNSKQFKAMRSDTKLCKQSYEKRCKNNALRCGTKQYQAIQRDTMRYKAVQRDAKRCKAIQSNSKLCEAIISYANKAMKSDAMR
jgi:hypothetical protein